MFMGWRAGWGQGPPDRQQAWGPFSGLERTAGNDVSQSHSLGDKETWLASLCFYQSVYQKLPEKGRVSGVEQEGSLPRSPLGECQWVSHCPQGLFCLSQGFGKSSTRFYFLLLRVFAQKEKWQSWVSPKAEWVKEYGTPDLCALFKYTSYTNCTVTWPGDIPSLCVYIAHPISKYNSANDCFALM